MLLWSCSCLLALHGEMVLNLNYRLDVVRVFLSFISVGGVERFLSYLLNESYFNHLYFFTLDDFYVTIPFHDSSIFLMERDL